MREIEFRGKNLNGEWVFGSLLKIGDSYHILEDCDMEEDGHHVKQISDRPTWVEEETIGQFTGIFDKNGKKIYEGDIIQYIKGQKRKSVNDPWEDDIVEWEVHYDEGCFSPFPFLSKVTNTIQIIGNIYGSN